MRIKFAIFFCFLSIAIFSQEIAQVKKGAHVVKLLKSSNSYALVYSDINSGKQPLEHSFNFSSKDSLFKIIMDGFYSNKDHQIIVLTDKDTVVKFKYKTIAGKQVLYFNQNNLLAQTTSTGPSLSKEEIMHLFADNYSSYFYMD